MAAKTEDFKTVFKLIDGGNRQAIPVASGQTIYGGTLAGVLASSGYLVNLTATTAPLCRAVAYVMDESDNASGPAATTANGSISGAKQKGSVPAGDKTVRDCSLDAKIQISATSITQAMLFKKMYAANNWTFDDAVGGIAVGSLVTYLSTTSGIIALNQYFETGENVTILRGPLVAATTTTGGDVLNLANPFGEIMIIDNLVTDITTQATGAANADCGVAATGTTNDTLIDQIDIGTAPLLADAINNAGTNGGTSRKWITTEFITITPSASAAGLVGTYLVKCYKLI